MEKRLGFVGIIIENREIAGKVNAILSEYGTIINGRIGIPDHDISGANVIGLIVKGTNDQLGALTGKLGNLPGVTVKSALTNVKQEGK